VPKSKLVGREAAAAQAGVAEAVVELAALGVGEHLVGLDHLLEARSASGSSETSGCKLAAQRAKAFLISASVAVRETPSSS
jgi:hypothetical protein